MGLHTDENGMVLAPEDAARRDCYALLARLFYAEPDEPFLGAIIAMVPDDGTAEGEVARALAALATAARRTNVPAEVQRFNDLFIGTGKAPVTLFLSHYLAQTGREGILVRLRDDLAGFGLARRGSAREPEDHIAGLCELMRHLVEQGSSGPSLDRQREIFERYFARGYAPLCDALIAAADGFYGEVARFAKTFLNVEAEAFSML